MPAKPRVIALRRAARSLPAHLPRETLIHGPQTCTCPDCVSALRKLSEDISEMLDFVPGYFKVTRHIRPTCRGQLATCRGGNPPHRIALRQRSTAIWL